MIGIVESGSTKTNWHFINNKNERFSYKTLGFNPAYQESNEISEVIENDLLGEIRFREKISKIYYYGASCESELNREKVKAAFSRSFPNIEVLVMHDLLAAAKALFGDKKGIACIAGTGSNTCYYNGMDVEENVHSLGLFLGDEGSGGYKGKLLLKRYIRKELPPHIMESFRQEYPDDPEVLLSKIYSSKMPSRFLASFAPFLLRNIQEPDIFKLVYQSFEELFDNCILRYGYKNLPIGFVGSIAHYFKDTLNKVASDKGLNISVIEADPSEALINYHYNQEYKP